MGTRKATKRKAKAKVMKSKSKRTAADLIKLKRDRAALPFEEPSPEAAAQILEIVEYNDNASANRRVSVHEALDMLANDYGWNHGRYALRTWLNVRHGRKSWSGK